MLPAIYEGGVRGVYEHRRKRNLAKGTDTRRKILEFIRKRGAAATSEEIAAGCGLATVRGVNHQLPRLVKAGALVVVDWGGHGQFRRYAIPVTR